MGDRTVPQERCPQCSAAVRPGAPWCTQCFAPVGAASADRLDRDSWAARQDRQEPVTAVPGTVPAPRTPADAAPPPPAAPPSPAATPPADDVSWPCGACGSRSPLTDAVCGTCGSAFLEQARGTRPALVLPLVGDVSALSTVRLVALGLALATVLLLVGLVAGALLT